MADSTSPPLNPLQPSHEEVKQPSSLLFSLKDFELVIVAKFLNVKDKLMRLGLLNKRCHSLVKKHYSWIKLPERGPHSLLSDCFDFLRGFPHFTNLHVPQYPA